jgi:hypothetical protein
MCTMSQETRSYRVIWDPGPIEFFPERKPVILFDQVKKNPHTLLSVLFS